MSQVSQYNIRSTQVDSSKDTSNMVSADYKEFEDRLMNRKVYNSTFKLDDNIVTSGNIMRYFCKILILQSVFCILILIIFDFSIRVCKGTGEIET